MKTSAGIVIVRKDHKEYLFLLLRSFNFWGFAKGRVEEGEDVLTAAIREVKEESSIDLGNLAFNWGENHYTTEPFNGYGGRKIDIYFIAETIVKDIILPISPELGKSEHDAYKWATYQEAKQLTDKRIGKVIDWANGIINE